MFEIAYIALIVIQFVIGPIIAFVPMSATLMWTLFGVQVVAAIVQNVQFPCFTFRTTASALIGLTLASMYMATHSAEMANILSSII